MPSERQHRIDWEHVFFLALMLGFLVWYLWTSTVASPTFSNLILIAPVGAVAAIFLVYIAWTELAGPHVALTSAALAQTEAAAKAPDRAFAPARSPRSGC